MALPLTGCSLLFDARDLASSFDGGEPPPFAIARFDASPARIRLGETSRIGFALEGTASAVTLESPISDTAIPIGAPSLTSGAWLVQPKVTSAYRLRVTFGGATHEAEVTVLVDRDVPPEIGSFSVTPRVIREGAIGVEWSVASAERVEISIGDETLFDFEGRFGTDATETTDVELMASAGAHTAFRQARAWDLDRTAITTDESSPHRIGAAAVLVGGSRHYFEWMVPVRSLLLPAVLGPDDVCAGAQLKLQTTAGQVVTIVPDLCGSEPIPVDGGTYWAEVELTGMPEPELAFVPDRVPSACSNGFVEEGEGCDDFDAIPGDGCDGDCQRETGFGFEREPPIPFVIGDLATTDAFVTTSRGGAYAVLEAPFPIEMFGLTYAAVIVFSTGRITFDVRSTLDPFASGARIDALVREGDPLEHAIRTSATSDRLIVELESAAVGRTIVTFSRDGAVEIAFGALLPLPGDVRSGVVDRTGLLALETVDCEGCDLTAALSDRSIRFSPR